MLQRVVWCILTDVSVVLSAYIIRTIQDDAIRISETSVRFFEFARLGFPENSHINLAVGKGMKYKLKY
jgi:hypothetical protein